MIEFAKEIGTVKPDSTNTSTRGGGKGSTKLYAKDTGTIKPSGGDISTKGGQK